MVMMMMILCLMILMWRPMSRPGMHNRIRKMPTKMSTRSNAFQYDRTPRARQDITRMPNSATNTAVNTTSKKQNAYYFDEHIDTKHISMNYNDNMYLYDTYYCDGYVGHILVNYYNNDECTYHLLL